MTIGSQRSVSKRSSSANSSLRGIIAGRRTIPSGSSRGALTTALGTMLPAPAGRQPGCLPAPDRAVRFASVGVMALSDRIDPGPAQEPDSAAAQPVRAAPEKEPIDRALLVVAGVVVLGAIMSILDTTV